MKHCLVFASLISPSKMILFEKKYQTFDTVFHHQMKHLEVRQKYSATRRIFNSLLGVSSGDETLRLMFDILLQNGAARLVLRTRSSEHITPVIRQLHWLPIKQLIAYKILLLTYKAMNGMAPKYIVDLLERFTPKSQLRSSQSNNINLLVIQKSNLKSFGDRSFRVAAPRLWNVLPNSTRSIQCLNVFKNK